VANNVKLISKPVSSQYLEVRIPRGMDDRKRNPWIQEIASPVFSSGISMRTEIPRHLPAVVERDP